MTRRSVGRSQNEEKKNYKENRSRCIHTTLRNPVALANVWQQPAIDGIQNQLILQREGKLRKQNRRAAYSELISGGFLNAISELR